MKIIRPVVIGAENMSSNAPPDEAIGWEAIGRDFAQDFGEVMVTASSSKVYALDSSSGQFEGSIKVQDVSSGNTEVLDLNGVTIAPTGIFVSADDAFLAMAGDAGSANYEMHIYSLATGNRVYRRQDTGNDGEFYAKPYGGAWSPGSDFFAFWANTDSSPTKGDLKPRIIIVDSSDWSSVESATPTDLRSNEPAPAYDWVVGSTSLCFDNSGVFVYGNCYSYGESNSLSTERAIFKVQVSDGLTTHAVLNGLYAYLVYNQYRSEVICVSGTSVEIRDAGDLSVNPDEPDFSGMTRYSTSLVKALNGQDRLFVQDGGSDVRHKVFALSDYSDKGALDPNTEIRLIDETSAYYVTRPYPADGFRLIDKGTFEKEGLLNPDVVEGAIYQYGNRLYEALVDNNDRPDMGALLDPPTWLGLGVINSLRLADGQVGTYTEAEEPLEVMFSNVDIVDGIALFNLLAQTVLIELVDETEGVVFSTGDISLVDNTGVTDWYQYFYSPITNRQDFVFTGLPPYRGADVRVVLTDVSGVLQVGEIALGPIRNLGDTEFGTSVGILDFSRKDRDTFGNFIITERRFSKRANYDISLRTNQIAFAQQLLAKLRATPAVFIGAESQPETIIYGFYRSFDIVLRGPVYSDCTIEVEGLT